MAKRSIWIEEARTPVYWILNLVHLGGFAIAILARGPIVLLGLGLVILSWIGQAMRWRRIFESWTGNIAAFVSIRWFIRVGGYDEGGRTSNLALGIVIVAAEIIVALLLSAWLAARPKLDPDSGSLTPPPSDS